MNFSIVVTYLDPMRSLDAASKSQSEHAKRTICRIARACISERRHRLHVICGAFFRIENCWDAAESRVRPSEGVITPAMTAQFTLNFPQDFKWGTATASHQVEGGNTNNQWHAWEQLPGNIHNGDKSGLACDWWTDAESDFDRMADMGLNAHRLSIEWSRVEPREGVYDDATLARYRDMLLHLRKNGIEPMVTLHHFTTPLWLEERGGLTNPALAIPAFERYVARTVSALSDVCDLWCTINEPNVFAVMGFLAGRMPPGNEGNFDTTLRVACTMLAMHSVAAEAIRGVQSRARIGFAHPGCATSNPCARTMCWTSSPRASRTCCLTAQCLTH
jgi:Glycosyl hydrolase family 1